MKTARNTKHNWQSPHIHVCT